MCVFPFFPFPMASPCLPGGGRRRGELAVVLNAGSGKQSGGWMGGWMDGWMDAPPLSSPRSAALHLRWLPLDFSDIVTEMGSIMQFMGSARDAD